MAGGKRFPGRPGGTALPVAQPGPRDGGERLKRAEAAVAELRRDADLGVAYPGLLEVPGRDAAAAGTARIPLGTLAPDVVRPETEVKQITHAIRMTAYNAETALARAPHRHDAGAGDEACALIRGALTASGDVHIAPGEPLIRLDPLYAPGGLRPKPASAASSPPPAPATPAPISFCATRSNPAQALHKRSPYVGVLGPAEAAE